MIRIAAPILIIGLTFSVPVLAGEFSPYVDGQGRISLPEDYRVRWAHLGSWVVPDEEAEGYGFHDVYTQPESVKAYSEQGDFPDGTVLVKEIRKVRADQMTTGQVSWAGDMQVWFVMIRDQKGRFPENANWGDGWGWALFEAGAPEKNTSKNYQNDCIPCHIPAKETNWVYVQGYPALRQK